VAKINWHQVSKLRSQTDKKKSWRKRALAGCSEKPFLKVKPDIKLALLYTRPEREEVRGGEGGGRRGRREARAASGERRASTSCMQQVDVRSRGRPSAQREQEACAHVHAPQVGQRSNVKKAA